MEFNATFIVSALSFIVFSVIMNAIFYKPLQKIVLERKKFIDDHHEEAALTRARSKAVIIDRDEKLDNTKHHSKKIIAEKTTEAKTQKSVIAQEAQQKAFSTINEAKNELYKSSNDAKAVLANKVVDLAQNISSKVLNEDIPIADIDKSLIEKAMEDKK